MTDTSSLNVAGLLQKAVPQGPGVEDDATLTTTADVYEVDPARARVRVAIRGGGDVWLPATAGRYTTSSLARVLLDPTSARPVRVDGPVFPRDTAILCSVVSGPTSGKLTVYFDGANTVVPAMPGAYTVGQSAWVLLSDWGKPILVLGPSTEPAPGAPPSTPGGGGTSTIVVNTAIGPQISGTFRSGYGWDRWNTDRYGGASDVYQGNAYGSGALAGFAGFGDQVVNLGAISIDYMALVANKTADGNNATLVVQGSADGGRPAGAPSSSGDTASASIGSGGQGLLIFTPTMREAFRTGALKGLVAIGSDYGGFGGTATPGSFVLSIQYTRYA